MSKLSEVIKFKDNQYISRGNPYIIAEIGSNHDQSLVSAKKLIDVAAECGANAAKFQVFAADDLVSLNHPDRKLVESCVLETMWIPDLIAHCKSLNVDFLASTFSVSGFHILEEAGVVAHKIASSELLHTELILLTAKSRKPIFLSTGMSTWLDIELVINQITACGNADIIPMHCTSKYPLPVNESNLSLIPKFHERYGGLVGFSDHTESLISGSLAAVLGASVFEKHITLNKAAPGPDHHYALEPNEFFTYVENIFTALSSLGNAEKEYAPEESRGRRRQSVVFLNELHAGETITDSHVGVEGPRKGIPDYLVHLVIGKKVMIDKTVGDSLMWEDLY